MDRYLERRRFITLERVLIVALLCLLALLSQAQIVDEDVLRRIQLPAHEGVIASLAVLPDGTIAAGVSKAGGLILIDTTTWSVKRAIGVDGYNAGARLNTSRDGRWLQLKELWRFTSDANKDVQGLQQVMDVSTGRIVVDGGKSMDGALSADGKVFATLDAGAIDPSQRTGWKGTPGLPCGTRHERDRVKPRWIDRGREPQDHRGATGHRTECARR